MQWYGYGGDIGDLLYQWGQAGFFSYLLPFLLIFALVFAILTQMKIFKENRAISGVIALAVALMALQFDTVPLFFSEIFPNLGVGLAILLVAMILLGLFVTSGAVMGWILFGIGAIIFIVILGHTAGSLGVPFGYWLGEHWPTALLAAVIITLFILILVNPKREEKKPDKHYFFRGGE